MTNVDPQEFGEFKSSVATLSKTLDKHLTDCYESNKQVAKNLNRLALAVAFLAAMVLGVDGIAQVVAFLS